MIEQVVRDLAQRRSIRLIAIVAGLTVAAGTFEYCERPASALESGNLGTLADIVGKHRLTLARLSGGFAYAPCELDSSGTGLVRGLVCREEKATSWTSAGRLRKFAEQLRRQDGAAASDAHISGVWGLVWGSIDDAIADLREATRRNPSNASALNDLAVALTERAERNDDPSVLIDAFMAADSAVRLSPSSREAQFTLAVLLERLYLRRDAIDAWNRYLKLDSSSPWAKEAQKRLVALRPRTDLWKDANERLLHALSISDSQTIRSIVRDHPSDTRKMIQQKLGEWGTTLSRGDSANARAQLAIARTLAAPLRDATGDALMVDAVAAIDRALTQKDVARLQALTNGYPALAKGEQARASAAGRADLATARKLLAFGGSPMRQWALLQEGLGQFRWQDSALATLRAVRDSAPKQYRVLRSMAAQYEGLIYNQRSDYGHSLTAYDTALAESRGTDEPQIAPRVDAWLAEVEAVLRGRQAGWRRRYRVLTTTPRYPTSNSALYTAFDYAAMATADEAPRLALRYSSEAIRIAREPADLAEMSYALRRRAGLLARLGQIDSAKHDIAAALDVARQFSDTTARTKQIADVLFAGAQIDLPSAPATAETELRQVIDEYRAKKYEMDLSMAYLYLAQSRVAMGKIEPARAAFDSATGLMQRQRATVKDYAERVRFLDAARNVIDQVVAFHATHSKRDAFEYFEATRSRVLLEELEQGRGESASLPRSASALASLQRRLAKHDLVLSYAVLPSELLIWVIGPDRFEQHRIAVTARELEGLVGQFRQSMLDGSTEPDLGVSGRLYRILVDSAGQLDDSANLIVIPDGPLHFVPFVALRDAATGHYLVRQHAVRYAPSATLLAANLARTQPRFSHSSRILAIGNPAFDRRTFQLPYLPAADGEARRIASLYSNETLLTGPAATDAALQRLAPSFDIVHFAGHAIVGREAPELSHLVLASDGTSEGVVFASEIARWRLARTQLVILSACSTAGGMLSATEGPSSLARAFFAAGVPAVVSSLWAIDDDNDTADFFVAFHNKLAQGVPVAAALQETQIKWLGDGPTPAHPVRSWAAFQLFGS